MDYLNSFMTNTSDSIPVIVGDLNADPGQSGGPLATTPNEHGKILLRYLTRWNFVSTHLNSPSASVGKSFHTYTSEAHHSSSTIDHILCPKHFPSNLSHCRDYDENPLNLSDHLLVIGRLFCRLSMLTNVSSSSIITPKPNWSRLSSSEIADTYTVQVQSALSSLSFPNSSFSSIRPSDIDSRTQSPQRNFYYTSSLAGIRHYPRLTGSLNLDTELGLKLVDPEIPLINIDQLTSALRHVSGRY